MDFSTAGYLGGARKISPTASTSESAFVIGTGPASTVNPAFGYLGISPGSTYYLTDHMLFLVAVSHFAFFCFTFARRACAARSFALRLLALAAACEGLIAIDLVIVFGLAFLAFLPSSFVVWVESLPAAVDSIVEIAEPETITTAPDVRCTLN
jgi:hypothetical protein